MGGGGLYGQPQAGGPAAEALGPNAQAVDFFQQLRLQGGVEGVRIGLVNGTEESVLGHGGHFVKGAADAHTQHHRGTGVGAGLLYGVHHKAPDALHPVGGLEHG